MTDTTLWAVHVQGPDDVFACQDRALADALALVLNRQFQRHSKSGDPMMVATVIEWPYGYEAWKADCEQLRFDVVPVRVSQQGARMTEQEMQQAEVPTHATVDELAAYITSLVEQEHDYGTCVYAMSMAATAAFNYVSRALGVTGFQASCADLDIVRRTRRLAGPFMLIDGGKMLYPQYDLRKQLDDALTEWSAWAAEEAKKKLHTNTADAAPAVVEHWKRLAQERA